MILTCPECATSYFVDDARIPSRGRSVKCSNCGARWMAEKGSGPVPAAGDASPAPEPEPELPPPAEEVSVEGPFAADPVADFAPPPVTTARKRARPKAGVWAAAAAVVLALLVTGAVLFRAQVARLWPSTAAGYSAIGLGIGGSGLLIEAVTAEAVFTAGRPALTVSGEIRNPGKTAVEAPPLRIALLDKGGRSIAAKSARAEDALVPARARRYFTVSFVDPPKGFHQLDVAFAPIKAIPSKHGPSKHGAARHDAPRHDAPRHDAPPDAAPAAPHVPEPEEARPLPAGSPDALDHG